MHTELPRNLLLSGVAILLVGNIYLYESFVRTSLKVSILGVGKGERVVLVQTPDHKTILINTGPDASILRALGTTLPPWQHTLDAILLTNSSTAVTKGLPEVFRHYRVLTPPQTSKTLNLSNETLISTYASGEITILYEESSLHITKNTPEGVFFSNGKTFKP